MKNLLRFVLSIVLSILISGINLAQSSRESLKIFTQNSETVVEGEVFAQDGFLDESNGDIKTANYLEVYTTFKGGFLDTVVIFTLGGTIKDRTQRISHSPKLNIGEKGIFLLQKRTPKYFNGRPCYELNAGNFSIINHLHADRDKEGYCPGTGESIKSWREIREQIGRWCDMDLGVLPAKISLNTALVPESELCIKLANPIPIYGTKKIQFDIYAKSNTSGLAFEGIDLFLDYPTDHIHSNIVSNGGISISKETVIAAPIYQLSAQDETDSKLNIHIGTGCINSTNYYILGTEYEKLARVVLEVSNWGSLGTLNLESFTLEGEASYYIPPGRCYNFDRVCGEGEVGFNPCKVDKITVAPFADGIGQILTITGEDLGTGTLGEITIPNPDDGGATDFNISGGPLFSPRYFESWTDTEIKVKLSSLGPGNHPFGSGLWVIDPDFTSQDPNSLVCFVKVEIEYALDNETINDIDKMIAPAKLPTVTNPDGAFEWHLDAGIDTDPVLQAQGITFAMVEEVAKAAFCDFEIAAGIETRYLGPLSNPSNNDNLNVVMFANLDPGIGGTTTRDYSVYPCDNDPVFARRVNGADIRLNKSSLWFVSTNVTGIQDLQFDLYSTLLHEIGHVFGHEHAMDAEDNGIDDIHLMYYTTQDELIKRNIDLGAINGVQTLIQRTLNSISTPGQCCEGFVLNTNPVGCGSNTTTETIQNDCKFLSNSLVKKGENIRVDLDLSQDKRLLLLNTSGQILWNSNGFDNEIIEIPTFEFSSGVYFLQYYCNGIPQVEKIIVH